MSQENELHNNPIITLTTDFGLVDPYVAAMKGVIYSICPVARIVDLGHEISAHDVIAGALFVAGSAPYFPPGTIHVVVIDPGVGSSRKPIAALAGEQIFICPDNGLLTLVLRKLPLREIREINNPELMLNTVSPTFHGRDVFAPASAHIANGIAFSQLGPQLHEIEKLTIPEPEVKENEISGEIIHSDHFGNLITNIPRSLIPDAVHCNIIVGEHILKGIEQTYADVNEGSALALFGSSDYLEIAANKCNAAELIGLIKGNKVRVTF